MKKIILLPCLTLLVLTFTSCSIQKRVYRDGYHIEWNFAKNDAKQNEQVVITSEENSVEIQKENEVVTPEQDLRDAVAVAPETPATSEEATTSENKAVTENLLSEKPAVVKKDVSIWSKIIKDDSQEDLELISNGSKATAFKSGFKKGLKLMLPDAEAYTLRLSIASFVLGIISLFSYYGAFVLGLLAIIFGIIAIHKIRNSGGAYRGNTFAWLGLIFGIIAIIATSVYLKVY